jgi:peptide/nickel transport system ATP-binding protein
MMPLLWVQHLSIGIKQGSRILSAVDDISFWINPGEITGIVGESGCGKTLTALSIPSLLPEGVRVTGGAIIFKNRELTALAPRDFNHIRGNEISMVFQEPMTSLNPLHKIGRQIAEPLRRHGWKNKHLIQKEVLDIMEKVGLAEPEKLLDRYPHQLSGGMRQRVMIALAMVCKPALLIADEPTTALDVTIQAQILRLMRMINETFGTSILFISHDLGVVSRICDRVLVMYAGKLIEGGKSRNIFHHPVHEYTKGLIGSIPTKDKKGKDLINIPGKVPTIDEQRICCPFAPRCVKAEDRCYQSFPENLDLSESHYVRCFLADPESEMEYVRL